MLKLNHYSNMSDEEVILDISKEYYVSIDTLHKYDILIADYDFYNYEGYGFLLLKDKETGILFENHASHCSCRGLEYQFDPQETTLSYLKSKHFYCNMDNSIKEFVKNL